MKLWIGGEVCADVVDLIRPARKTVESCINGAIGTKQYQLPVDDWDCIIVMRDDDSFPERTRFQKKTREMDFRLRIDHALFKQATLIERERMIYEMLVRSLNLLRDIAGDAPGFPELLDDISAVATTHGWSNPKCSRSGTS